MKGSETVAAIAFIALGSAAIALTMGFDQTLITDNYLGASFFPRIVASSMIILGLIVLAGALKSKKAPKGTPITGAGIVRSMAGIASVAVYAKALEPLGFIISTAALNLAILTIFGVKKPLTLILLPIVATLSVYWIFCKILMVPLPEGIFFF